jgi:hypothetical protein
MAAKGTRPSLYPSEILAEMHLAEQDGILPADLGTIRLSTVPFDYPGYAAHEFLGKTRWGPPRHRGAGPWPRPPWQVVDYFSARQILKITPVPGI